MLEAGYVYDLKIAREASSGLYLKDEDDEEVLLPFRLAPENFKVGDEIRVFIYPDSEDRLISTTKIPIIQCDQFACLTAKEVGPLGAFMDMGTDKDLLVPYREQKSEIKKGKQYVVYMFTDPLSGRLVGSTHLNRFLENTVPAYTINEEVDIIIYEETELGFKAIINQEFSGLLYKNEVFQEVQLGLELKAFIKNVREDGKIDLSLKRSGYIHVNASADKLQQALREHDGHLALHDKSSPEEIYKFLGMSKKTFKKALGLLYKERIVSIDDTGIKLN